MKINNLTSFQEAFAQSYVRNGKKGNQSDAYREAGYSVKNKTAKSIHEAASRLMKNIKVLARIKELQESAQEVAKTKFEIDSEEILKQLDIFRKARIDEYVEYVTVVTPIFKTVTTTTGTGKNKVTTTTTETSEKTETLMVFKPWDNLTDDQKMAIESVKQDRYGNIELKLHGKQWTIDMINKHLGLYEKHNQQKAPPEQVNNIDMSKIPTDALMAIAAAYKKPEDEE